MDDDEKDFAFIGKVVAVVILLVIADHVFCDGEFLRAILSVIFN